MIARRRFVFRIALFYRRMGESRKCSRCQRHASPSFVFRRVPSLSSTRRCRVNTPVRTRATATRPRSTFELTIPRSNGARSPRRALFSAVTPRGGGSRILLDRGIRGTNREPLEPSIWVYFVPTRKTKISRAQRPTCQQSTLDWLLRAGFPFRGRKDALFFRSESYPAPRPTRGPRPRAHNAPRRETAARDRIEASERRYAIRRVISTRARVPRSAPDDRRVEPTIGEYFSIDRTRQVSRPVGAPAHAGASPSPRSGR